MVTRSSFAGGIPEDGAAGYDFGWLSTRAGGDVDSRGLSYVAESLANRGIEPGQASAILAAIADASGGDPFAMSADGSRVGLLLTEGCRPNIFRSERDEIDAQLDDILEDDSLDMRPVSETLALTADEILSMIYSPAEVREGTPQVGNTFANGGHVDFGVLMQNGAKASKEDIMPIQQSLINAGYSVGRTGVDGLLGKNTIKGIQQYLVDNGNNIAVDGILGPKTMNALAQYSDSDNRKFKKPSHKTVNSVMDSTSVYPKLKSNTQDSDEYHGPFNFGQIINDKYNNFKTQTGLDLSNIDTSNVPESKKKDFTNNIRGLAKFYYKDYDSVPKTPERGTEQCASHVTYKFLDTGAANIDKYDIRGDAWTMGDRVVKAGGQRLYDMFAFTDRPSGDYNNHTKQDTISFVRRHSAKPDYKQYLSDNLMAGDIVELLYPSSKNFGKAYQATGGKRQNTHIGVIVQIGNELYVEDNSGGHLHHRKLSTVLDGKDSQGVLITGAVRTEEQKNMHVKEGLDMSEFGVTPNMEQDAKHYRLDNDAAYRAIGAIYKNKEKLRTDNELSVDEFNRVTGLTQAVMFKESQNGQFFNNNQWISKAGKAAINDENRDEVIPWRRISYSILKRPLYFMSDVANGAFADLLPDAIGRHAETSVGLGHVKYHGKVSPLTDKSREQLGGHEIVAALRRNHPETSGVTTFYALSNLFHKTKQLLNSYLPEEYANNPETIDGITALAYNQGFDMIEESLKNAKSDKQYQKHIDMLLGRDEEVGNTYGGNALILRNYNKYDMYSGEEKEEAEQKEKEKGKSREWPYHFTPFSPLDIADKGYWHPENAGSFSQ